MITAWDQYNNPKQGRYRDPEIELQNIKNSGNPNNKYNLSPFGFIYEKDSEGRTIEKIRFPKEYEKRYSETDENWLEICYNIIQTSANRHFWFLLTLQQKYEMCKFLLKHKKDRVYKMAKSSYTFEDLYCDLSKFQFTEDNDIFMRWIFTNDAEKISHHKDEKYVNYGNDYFVLHSLRMWKDFIFESVKDRLVIVDIDKENIYIHDGQYIINYQDPYGQKGR